MSEIVDLLESARGLLMRSSWVGHAPDVELNEHCTVTPLDYAENANIETIDTANRYLDYAAFKLFPERSKFGEYLAAVNVNDHGATQFNDVMAVYDEAIRRAKEDQV